MAKRDNTSSGKPQEPMTVSKATGAASVGKILGAREPGKASGFRPGGRNGYNVVGGSSGLQVKIPAYRDQSDVHASKGVTPTHKDSP